MEVLMNCVRYLLCLMISFFAAAPSGNSSRLFSFRGNSTKFFSSPAFHRLFFGAPRALLKSSRSFLPSCHITFVFVVASFSGNSLFTDKRILQFLFVTVDIFLWFDFSKLDKSSIARTFNISTLLIVYLNFIFVFYKSPRFLTNIQRIFIIQSILANYNNVKFLQTYLIFCSAHSLLVG